MGGRKPAKPSQLMCLSPQEKASIRPFRRIQAIVKWPDLPILCNSAGRLHHSPHEKIQHTGAAVLQNARIVISVTPNSGTKFTGGVTCSRTLRLKNERALMVSHKDCFGNLDAVFPMGKEGLREVPADCLECPDKKGCLQTALTTRKGLTFKCEILERAPAKGLVGWLKRWSEKKVLTRRIQEEKGKTQ